jgi:hypothetical protein
MNSVPGTIDGERSCAAEVPDTGIGIGLFRLQVKRFGDGLAGKVSLRQWRPVVRLRALIAKQGDRATPSSVSC